jgi:hypothetical protein
MIVKILTHMHMVIYTWWCWHISEGSRVWVVERGLGFRRFRENQMPIFHCAGCENRRQSHGGGCCCFTSDRRCPREQQTLPSASVGLPWWWPAVVARQTRWWPRDGRTTSASVDSGVSRAQKRAEVSYARQTLGGSGVGALDASVESRALLGSLDHVCQCDRR